VAHLAVVVVVEGVAALVQDHRLRQRVTTSPSVSCHLSQVTVSHRRFTAGEAHNVLDLTVPVIHVMIIIIILTIITPPHAP
jgi:hypothetical protein